MTSLKHEIDREICRIYLPSGQWIDVELFLRPGEIAPQISASSALQIQPLSSNRIALHSKRIDIAEKA